MFGISFCFGLVIALLGMMLAHWTPGANTAHPIIRYVIGIIGILAGAALWLLPLGQLDVLVGFIALSIAAGLGTVIGYGIDWLANVIQRAKINER